jgi:HEAT repeat protein
LTSGYRFLLFVLGFAPVALAQLPDLKTEEVLEALSDKDVNRRRDAAYELVNRLETDEPIVVALAKSIADPDEQVQLQSLIALARRGKGAEPAIAPLLKRLQDGSDQVRFRAADALGQIGAQSMPHLMKLWQDSTRKVGAAQAFAVMGTAASEALPLLREGIASGDTELPRFAAEAMVAIAPQDIEQILLLTRHHDPLVRRVGILAIANLNTPTKEALESLREGVKDEEVKNRELAILALAKSRMEPADKAELIAAALVDPIPSVRAAAIAGLRRAELSRTPFTDRIVEMLPSVEREIGNSLFKALATVSAKPLSLLTILLEQVDRSKFDSELVAEALASFGPEACPLLLSRATHGDADIISQALALMGDSAVPTLLQGLEAEDSSSRSVAARALGAARPMKRSHLEKLVLRLEDPAPGVRIAVVEALTAAGRDGAFAKDRLLAATRDAEERVRSSAMASLARFEFSEEATSDALDRGLEDASREVRLATLRVLGALPKHHRQHLPQVLLPMKSEDAGLRIAALATLGKFDRQAFDEGAIEGLTNALLHEDRETVLAATETVKGTKVGEPPIVSALGGKLNADEELVLSTLEAIAALGNQAGSLADSVTQLAVQGNAKYRVAALEALSALESRKERLSERLTHALEDSEWDVRRVATVGLGKLGAEGKQAVPKLIAMLADESDAEMASTALREINSAPVEAIPLLIEKLGTEDRRTRFYAVSFLGKIGPPAAEALPKLESMLEEVGRDGSRGSRSGFRERAIRESIAAIKGEKP